MTDTKVVPAEQNVPATDLATLTVEIKFYLHQSAQSIIEVGKRLIRAKEMVPHGEWANWLENNFRLKKTLAHNFMQVAKRFGDSSNNQNFRLNGNLNQTQLIAMLALPEGEEEDFIAAKAAEGTPVEDMTVRKLNEEIRQWKQKAEDAEKILAKTEADLSLHKEMVEVRDGQIRTLQDEGMQFIKDAKKNNEKIEELEDERDDLKEDIKLRDIEIRELKRSYEDLKIEFEIRPEKEVVPRDYESLKRDKDRLEREVKELQERPVEVAVQKPADYNALKEKVFKLEGREGNFRRVYGTVKTLQTIITDITNLAARPGIKESLKYIYDDEPTLYQKAIDEIESFSALMERIKPSQKSREDMLAEIKSLQAECGDSTVKDFVQAAGLNTAKELNNAQLDELLKQLQSR
ncbi:MAG: DUF3102 domain-containing protein [Selenomonadaceae bacterium]|nr:DUF3102 domain-containing protein [Selenomonadaceae bacterium]